ncbi:DotA/TraY family protein [Burkholderia sp. Tr-20390]|uniref:DotA/TraY family protein n=1 Tax=Burkholderia sp. Tr-20390 TaxID=2703904 RepID=UPI0019804372|nr:DotA/TraY family protein [Burkholderia sp. Tr-20390]MBN3729521.1 DotA/TraY family protein [Burkholderia sp. Tr-20390]
MANPFTPSPTDAAVKVLQMIFGDVITHLVSGMTPGAASNAAATMLGVAFRYFNGGVLVFGSFILTWVTIFGIANSANDGEVLGKQWSTFYTPIRTVSAAAVLMPTSSGFAGIQIILLLVVTWSIGFASNIWTAVATYSISQSITSAATSSITSDPNFESNIASAIRMGACARGVNNAMATLMPDSRINLQLQTAQSKDQHFGETTYVTTYTYADPNWAGSAAICGTMTLTDSYPIVSNAVNSIFSGNPSSGNTSSNTQTADMLRRNIADARNNFFTSVFQQFVPNAVSQIANAAVSTADIQLSATALSNAIAAEKQLLAGDVQQAVLQTISGQNSSFVSTMTSQGWIFAASYWTDLGRIKDAVRTATTSKVNFTAGSNTLENLLPPGVVLIAANATMASVSNLATLLTNKALSTASSNASTSTPAIPSLQTTFTLNDFTDGDSATKTMFGKWFRHLGTSLIAGMVNFLGDPNEDPVMQVKSLGDWISSFAEGVFLLKTTVHATLEGLGATAASSMLPGTSIAAGFAKAAAVFFTDMFALVSPSLFMLMYAGYFLGIWIPMVPFYVFAIGVVGWLVFVIEMMAAGVLWAAAHTTPARDNSFIGSQMQGYMLVMSGFFRPALMVVGLVASNAVLYPSIAYINASFITRVQAIQQDTVTGPLSIAAFMLVYCVIIFAVFMLVFSLPQTLPDRILRWIGAGVGDLGEQNSMGKIEGSASSQARTAMITAATKQSHLSQARQKQRDDDARRAFAAADESVKQSALDTPATETGPGPLRIE